MPVLRANDCDLYVEAEGSGPPLVFIHGEGQGIEYFEHQVERFSSSHRCIVFERRGHGRSETPEYGYSLHNQARDVAALLDHLDVREPATVVGVAFGTTVAAELALHWPDRVNGLVLVAWSELQSVEDYLSFFRAQTPLVLGLLADGGHEAVLRHFLDGGREASPVLPEREPLRSTYAGWLARRSERAWLGRLELVASVPVLVDQMGALPIPVLGVEGSRDPFPCAASALAHLPRFRQEYIEGDRFVQWEHAEQFNALLAGFLDEVS